MSKRMQAKIFFFLLIISSILSEGFATLSRENVSESSDLHIRKKRVINTSLTSDFRRLSLNQFFYMVNIHGNGHPICGGAILTPTIIVTAAHCVHKVGMYSVLSNTINLHRGFLHNVTQKIEFPNYNPHRLSNDLALLIISPPIDLINSYNRRITLHNGPLPQNATGTISGWGCTRIVGNLNFRPRQLQAIKVPFIDWQECRYMYRNFHEVTDKDICTFDRNGRKGCSHGDSGGPLVVDSQLVGILAWQRVSLGLDYPDVYMNLMHPVYKTWINSYIQNHG